MSVMIRKLIATIFILVFALVSCASAAFDPLSTVSSLFDSENGYHLELSADIISHMPYSQDRLVSLNNLLHYLSLTADVNDQQCSAILWVNNKPQVTFVRDQSNGKKIDWIDALPQTVFVGDQSNGILETFDPITNTDISNEIGLHGDEYAILSNLKEIMMIMPALFSETKHKVEKIRVKIGDFGTATQKITLTFSTDFVQNDELYKNILKKSCKAERLKTWFDQISFTGRQTLTQYLDEEEKVIRFIYAGSIRYADGKIHKLNLNWKTNNSIQKSREEIQLKIPAATGNDRDILTLNLETDELENKSNIHCQYDYTHVYGKEKDIYHGNIDLDIGSDIHNHLKGVVALNRKHNTEIKKGWVFEPEIDIVGQYEEIFGDLKIVRTEAEESPESFILHLKLRNNAEPKSIPDDALHGMITTNEQFLTEVWPQLSQAVTHKLVISLLQLPEHALQFFSDGLNENQWEKITNVIH